MPIVTPAGTSLPVFPFRPTECSLSPACALKASSHRRSKARRLDPGRPTTIRGVAWGSDPVASVEVSVDGGRSWKPAALNSTQRPASAGASGNSYGRRSKRPTTPSSPEPASVRQHPAPRPGVEPFRLPVECNPAVHVSVGDAAPAPSVTSQTTTSPPARCVPQLYRLPQ